jgi:purine-binding chemotaxis protein CheW
MQQLVMWTFDEQRYALPLAVVDRIVRAVEILPLPTAPKIVSGIVNIQGRIVPVVDMRRRLGLPLRDAVPSDQIVVAQTSRRTVAFFIDAIGGVVECTDDSIVPGTRIVPGLEGVNGVVKMEDGMILVQDLDRFLSLDEETVLEKALCDAH